MRSHTSLHSDRSINPQLASVVEATLIRIENGEVVDVESLVAAHPQFAAELRELLATAALLLRLSDDGTVNVGPTSGPANHFEQSAHRQIGDFRIIRELGRGGMGTVFEAEQLSMGRLIALKVLPFASLASEKALTRFKNEIRTAASLDHPHIASVFASGEERGIHFYAMQLIRGRNLAEIIGSLRGEGQLEDGAKHLGDNTEVGSPFMAETTSLAALSTTHSRHRADFFRRVGDLAMQACDALQFAHEMGVVHRDIKPSNLLLNSHGRLWITDFGLALNSADPALTITGDLLGTLRYMSPEQALGERHVLDQRTDIYSLGATLYELATLHPPFDEINPHRFLRLLADERPLPPHRRDPSVPVDLETIIHKALEKNPIDRYQTAQEMGDDLRRFCDGRSVWARKAGHAERVLRWTQRNPMTSALISVIVVLSCVIASTTTFGYLHTKAALSEKNRALTQLRKEQATSNQSLYAAEMVVAHERWKGGQRDGVMQLLERHLPLAGHRDIRGWEWYYLLSLCNQDLARLRGPGNVMTSVAWNLDGNRLAAAGESGALLFDVATGRKSWSNRVPSRSICWSPNGSRFVTASLTSPPVVCVRDASSGRQIMTLTAGHNPMSSVGWSPDGSMIAAGCFDGTQTIWDATTGQTIRKMGHEASPTKWSDWRGGFPLNSNFVAWHPNSKWLISSSTSQAVGIWEVDSGRKIKSFGKRHHSVIGMALSPDGRWIAIASWKKAESGTILVWDLETGILTHQLPTAAEVLSLAYSPDSRWLAAGVRGNHTDIWDMKTAEFSRQMTTHSFSSFSVAFSPDGRRLATGHADGMVKIWDATRTHDAVEFRNEHWSGPLILAPDGHRFACGAGADDVAIYDTASGEPILHFRGRNHEFRRPAWSTDGHYLAWAASARGMFDIVDAETGGIKCTFNQGAQVTALEFSPDGNRIVSASADSGTAKIWNIASATLVETLQADPSGVYAVGWHPDGNQLATTGSEEMIKIWNTSHGVLDSQFPSCGEGRWLASLTWSPDGRRLAGGGWDQIVKVWDVETGRVDATRLGHAGSVNSVAWLAGGERIATTSSDGTVIIWAADSTDQLLSLDAGGHIDSAACSYDGWTLAALSHGELKLWNARPGFEMAQRRKLE